MAANNHRISNNILRQLSFGTIDSREGVAQIGKEGMDMKLPNILRPGNGYEHALQGSIGAAVFAVASVVVGNIIVPMIKKKK